MPLRGILEEVTIKFAESSQSYNEAIRLLSK